jgi:hypothetical protein
VVTISSSDTEEALELWSLSPACVPHSRLFEPSSSSGSDLFIDWPEANDMVVSVYVAMTVDALSSHTSAVNARMVNESPELIARLHNSLDHGRHHHEGQAENSPKVLMLHARDLKDSRDL